MTKASTQSRKSVPRRAGGGAAGTVRGLQYRIEQDRRSGTCVVVPVPGRIATLPERRDFAARWAHMDELAAQLDATWPAGVSAVDAVADVRRSE